MYVRTADNHKIIENQEGKERRQDGQADIAGDRPAVLSEKPPISIKEYNEDLAHRPIRQAGKAIVGLPAALVR